MTSVLLRPLRDSRPLRSAARQRDVVLIGFQDQGNLGMGYLGAVLQEHGYEVELVEFRSGHEAIIDVIRNTQPLVVGFSMIFQFFLPEYAALAQALRDVGVTAHFTIGGHYPSLCHEDVLAEMPQLDSVARFEGEMTLLDLVTSLSRGMDWHQVAGLAWRDGDKVVESQPRALIKDLDTLPVPMRPGEPEHVLGWKTLPLLASRGCARRCSFCSIQTFYRAAPGKIVRVRQPAKVVEEMRHLAEDHGVSIFLFQDDDFPLFAVYRREWAPQLIHELHQQGVAERAIWKISCRAEYVEPELFKQLQEAGLYMVYMGLESGSEEGLSVLHKGISVETNRRAIEILKGLGLLFQYGFMLFDPSSTFESVRTNIDFLRSIVGDGSAGALFCRMLPYGGTPIRDQLAAEGRLKGDVVRPDYDFLDLRLNEYHRRLDEAVSHWVHGDGASFQLNTAMHELAVMRRLVGDLDGIDLYEAALRRLTAESNEGLFRFVEETSIRFEAGDDTMLRPNAVHATCLEIVRRMLKLRNAFVEANKQRLIGALVHRDALLGPITAPQRF
jgi:anaerobic magnesium-protoporphyrin IX monomethyl ester cyclase